MAWLIAGVILLNLAWRVVRYAMCFPLWGDEAFVAVNFQVRDFRGMFSPLDYGQIAPLLTMWGTLAVTHLLGINEYSLRLVSFLAGVASMLLFWRFSRRVLNVRQALLAVALFAASYYTVRHATEVKPYACDLFVALVLMSLGWMVFRHPHLKRYWAALIVAGVVAPWASYTAIFVLASVGMLLLCLLERPPRRGALIGIAFYGALTLASFVVMMALYGQPHFHAASWLTEIDTWKPSFPPVEAPWRLPMWLVEIHCGNMLAYPVGGPNFESTLTFLLVVAGAVVLWRAQRRPLLLLLVGPLPFLFIAGALKRYPYGGSARICLFLAPAFCLLAAVGLHAILKRLFAADRLAWALRATWALMALIIIGGATTNVLAPYKIKSDVQVRRCAQELASRTRPGDRWVIFNARADVPYAPNLYLTGGWGARFRYYFAQNAPVPVEWAPQPDYVNGTPDGRTWLIAWAHHEKPAEESQLIRYVDAVTERLGAPTTQTVPLGPDESIRVYEFPVAKR